MTMRPATVATRNMAEARMHDNVPAYGLWSMVLLNSAIFIFFAFTFFKPTTSRDWRSFGAFSGFLVALFAEMYGFPLTIYLLRDGCRAATPTSTGSPMTPVTCWRRFSASGPIRIPARSTC